MFIYLSKKIAIPNGVRLRCLSWNPEHGWLSCGGEDGLLKVLKLDISAPPGASVRGIAAPANLSMNQTLEGHQSPVMVTTWNPQHRKLTTSDASGLIIVWLLHKGTWFEEMINNRNKSVVRDMRWRSDGSEICIAYEDGAVMVGGVDGNRIWSQELAMKLTLLEWAPDGHLLLLATADGKVLVYNHKGVQIGAVALPAIADIAPAPRVVCVEWYDGAEGHSFPDSPALVVAFENGRLQIMRNESDPSPVLVDTGLAPLTQAKWNTSGTVLAVAGTRAGAAVGGKEVVEVQFYTPFGRYITAMKVPGSAVPSITWEGGGLRLALAVDSFVYFANIRPDYKWGSFGDTVVYAFTRPDRAEQCVVFWNMRTDEKYVKYVKRLISLHAAGENCVLVTAAEDEVPEDADPAAVAAAAAARPAADPSGTPSATQYILILCNAIGSPVDSKYIDVRPDFVTMTPFHIVVASNNMLYLWQYRTQMAKLTSVDTGAAGLRRRDGRERVFHIDDSNAGVSATGEAVSAAQGDAAATTDNICSIAASSKYLLVGRESGIVQQYALPMVALENKFTLRCRPVTLALNSDSTRFAIIDINNVLSMFDMEARTVDAAGTPLQGEHLPFEKKDVWSVMWAEDYPDLWACMEKTRMYTYRGTDPEEPVLSSGYLCRFSDLTITSVLLDDVMAMPETPAKATMLVEHEIRSFRDARSLLARNGLKDSMTFIEDNSHPRLWRLLAETALEKLDLNTAEKAFVACSDYPGIQFVKRLRLLQDRNKQRAEILMYSKRLEEAEKIYTDIDRRDLAIDMRMRLGDWQRVLELLQSVGAGADDATLTLARTRMGDFWADRQKWRKAIPFYEMAKSYDALVECYYIVEDYNALQKLIDVLPEGSPLLANLGTKLQSVGLVDGAARALLRGGDVKGAVDACVVLNQWDKAVELAEKHRLPQIEGLLTKYASHLLDSGKTIAAIELYRRANRNAESAKLLAKLAAETGRSRINPLRAKKLFVLAALEVERHRKRTMDLSNMATTMATMTNAGGNTRTAAAMATAATLDTLLKADAEVGSTGGESGAAARTLDVAWHGAEAFHFYMLAQRQLYDGEIAAAMTTAQRLSLYEDIVDPKDIYSIVALTAYYNQCFGTCSRAFIKLEALEGAAQSEREAFADLALSIFMRARPADPADTPENSIKCPTPSCRATLKLWATNCMTCGASFPACVASGRPIFTNDYFRCKVCRHKAHTSEMEGRRACPLCHSAVAAPSASGAVPVSTVSVNLKTGAAAAPPGNQAGMGGTAAAGMRNSRMGLGPSAGGRA